MSSLNKVQWQRLQERLAQRQGATYWRSLEELTDEPAFHDLLASEFPQYQNIWSAPVDRRRVLKLMAASLALGGLTACDSQPRERLVPYVNKPEGLIPGQPRFYASTHPIDGYAHGVLVQSREGRPIKLEGNPDHPATRGALDAFSQASVLSLYDPERASTAMYRGRVASYTRFLGALQTQQAAWDDANGTGLAFLTGPMTSPSELVRLQWLLERWPNARWYRHAPVDRSAVYTASEWLFGEAREPIYHFDRARVVLSLDADFLQEQPGFLRYARDFAAQRRPRDTQDLLRLYMIESTPSITGSMAEHRLALRHDRVEEAARQLANAFGIDVPMASEPAVSDRWLTEVVEDLNRHGPATLVIPGDHQPPAVHALAHAINAKLGALGHSVETIAPVDASHSAGSLGELSAAMHADEVESLVILDANPLYSAPGDLDFAEAMKKVSWRCHWGVTANETTRFCHWHIPATHPLETWGDSRAYDGTLSVMQPLILPLHGGKTALQFLSALRDGIDRDARDLLMQHWREQAYPQSGGDFERFWRTCLRDGLLPGSAFAPRPTQLAENWRSHLAPFPDNPTDLMLQWRPDPSVWDGRYAHNAWLQELPRPLTKMTWGNALLIAPVLAARHGLSEGDVVRLGVNETWMEAPLYILPGMPEDAVTLTLGSGRQDGGTIGKNVGVDAYLVRSDDSPWSMAVTLEPTGKHQELATTQNHHAIEGRDMVRVTGLEHYREDPQFAQHGEPHASLYPEPRPTERDARHAWGMSIDLSACIGCNACVTACQAENNIPVVGAEEVRRGHEMHWIRIDRYFKGPLDGPELVFQPVTCMHCENAPCEYVCPVGATQHSVDGLNEMIYNRCIGTRYCSQNCPYKVRRFNWFQYTGDAAAHTIPPATYNPDVSVRPRGVMEKCTFCVQRIRRKERDAENEGRELADGELQTACQQTCPTQAIVFGDLKDPDSQVNRLKSLPLDYGMLAKLNVRPRLSYLAGVRNYNPRMPQAAAQASVGYYTPGENSEDSITSRIFHREMPS